MKTLILNFWSFLRKNLFTAFLALVIIALVVIILFRPANNGVTSAPEAGSMITQPVLKSAPLPANSIIFCLQLDERQDGHLPALMGGGNDAVANLDGTGSNFALTATASGDEDYGILPDGTFFAKEAFLKKWGMVSAVDIKCDRTNWSPVTMTAGNVNGQAAYLYK